MPKVNCDITAAQSGEKKIKLLFYNRFWNYDYPDSLTSSYPDFHFFFKEEDLQEVDVVVFHIPSLEILPQELKTLKTKKDQLWIYWSMECEAHYPEFQLQEIRRLFDLTVTYQLDADISTPYIGSIRHADWRMPVAKKTGFVNAFFSSRWDKSGRYNFLAELIPHLKIDSFGKIFNNMSREKDPYFKSGLVPESFYFKHNVISQYKFTLAFENARAKDYVTEKFFQPLLSGSVPVYLGAPNVDDFAPGDNCYINVNSFSSARELADYLTLLNNNDELYDEFLKWKKLPFRSEFESVLNSSSSNMFELLIPEIRKRLC